METMFRRTVRHGRIRQLSDEELARLPEYRAVNDTINHTIGFVPNSARTIARWPALAEGFRELAAAMREAVDTLPTGLANLIHLVASQAAGCTYCQAHGAVTTIAHGVPEEKLAAIWEFESSDLCEERERAALRLAAAAAVSPSAVTDQMMEDLHTLFDGEDVVRIVGVIAISGFMNRWNATAAKKLDDIAVSAAENRLAPGGWSIGIHG